MLRTVSRRIFLSLALVGGMAAAAARADDRGNALVEALAIRDVVGVMHDEGVAYGKDLESQMFPGKGGAGWMATVEGIYATDRLYPIVRDEFLRSLTTNDSDIDAMLAFAKSDLGHRAVTLEISARRALLDSSVEDAAKLKLAEMQEAEDPRLTEIQAFVEANDLVEANVSSGMNANLAFYRGLAQAGGFLHPMSEDEILSEVWSGEATLRSDTEQWLYSFLTLAYAPLSDADLKDYTAFTRSKPGRDMNKALFAGFDQIFVDVSGRLGRAAAQYVAGQDL